MLSGAESYWRCEVGGRCTEGYHGRGRMLGYSGFFHGVKSGDFC
jgi:hypothetical protein